MFRGGECSRSLVSRYYTSTFVSALSVPTRPLQFTPVYRKLSRGSRWINSQPQAQSAALTEYPDDHQALIPPPAAVGPNTRTWLQGKPDTGTRDMRHRIFCNRSLDLSSCKFVGFDMDYTLAQYKPETFEHLAYSQTLNKLTANFGYPAQLKDLTFDWQYMMRGLTIDKEMGNIIKVDRHKYVKLAYHGLSPLDADTRKRTYNQGTSRDSLDGDDYTTIDTLFSLAEAYLFMQVVDMKDSNEHLELASKSYKTMYRDIRGAVDLCHRDGSLKAAVAANPEKYIHQDPRLVDMLDMYRLAGRKVFLATNSLWDYTHVVMNYVLGGRVGADKTEEWLEYFEVVMTGCQKPKFFSERPPLFQVKTDNFTLLNTDNGAPILPIDQHDMPDGLPTFRKLGTSKVFQGGSVLDLHSMLGVEHGAEVLYVGDHIYGDILRSKKTLGWRTMLVVPELDMELRRGQQSQTTMLELQVLHRQRDHYDDRIQRAAWDIQGTRGGSEDEGTLQLVSALDKLKEERKIAAALHRSALGAHHRCFHPIWGQLLKTGYQNSKFAHLMERFACIYTSHVSNLAFYSPDQKFRGRLDVMAHESMNGHECN